MADETKKPAKVYTPEKKAAILLKNCMGHPELLAASLVGKMNAEEVQQMAALFDENANGNRVHAVYGQHLDRLRAEEEAKKKQSAPISVTEIADQKAVTGDDLPSATGGEVPAAIL